VSVRPCLDVLRQLWSMWAWNDTSLYSALAWSDSTHRPFILHLTRSSLLTLLLDLMIHHLIIWSRTNLGNGILFPVCALQHLIVLASPNPWGFSVMACFAWMRLLTATFNKPCLVYKALAESLLSCLNVQICDLCSLLIDTSWRCSQMSWRLLSLRRVVQLWVKDRVSITHTSSVAASMSRARVSHHLA
jgi:hypothetical protein